MQPRRPWTALSVGDPMAKAIAMVALFASLSAAAAGLGSGNSSATLGQPLNFVVPVRLDEGEVLSPECLAAEVMIGERRLPAPLVRASLETTGAQSARVRVQTQATVDEPVVQVSVAVGCSNRIARSYVVLADPPGIPMSAESRAQPAFAVDPPPVPALAASAPAAAPAAADTTTMAAARAPAPALTPEQVRARSERRARLRAQRQARQQAAREARVARQAQTSSSEPAAAAPRLKVDFVDGPPRSPGGVAESEAVTKAMAAVAEAASAAQAAASAASAASLRIAALEQELSSLRAEAKASRDIATVLRQRLVDAESSGRWTLPLVLGSLLLAVLAAWLAWRLGRVQALQRAQWQQDAAGIATVGPMTSASTMGLDAPASRVPTSPAPFVTQASPGHAGSSSSSSAAVPPTVSIAKPGAARTRANPAWPPPAPPVAWPPAASTLPPDLPTETMPGLGPDMTTVSDASRAARLGPDLSPDTPMQRTEAFPSGGRGGESLPRDVSIEELIDLEQQAEFFMVLGQEEAAVDLLVDHLRSTGGGSPLPYLKLLEIHHRRGDHEAYERMRQRFNHRFNAYAPEWGVDLTSGRSLEDYPGIIPRLEQVWSRPLDAMAELEALLFRKSRGELFDLPAYREVLFLYTLARDLLDRAAVDTGSVDLLLPMSDAAHTGDSSLGPLQGLERDAFKDTMPAEDPGATASLDFDLTGGDRKTSIFDLLDDKPSPTRRS